MTSSAARPISRHDIALAVSVGLLLFAIYLLSYRGGFHSVDEVSMFSVTESLVKFGRLNTDQIAWTQWTTSQREAQGFFGPDGHVYSKKGLAMSLAMLPLYWLGLVLPGLGMLQTVSLTNALITAASGWLLFLLVRRLGYHTGVATGVALLYGLASIAWVYSKYLFSEPLAGFLLLAAVYYALAFSQQGNAWRPALVGVLIGLAVLTRANNLFLVPVFALYLWGVAGRHSPASGETSEGSRGTGSDSWLPVVWFLLGLLPPLALVAGYNWLRSGHPLQTGYDLTIFSPAIWWGLYKLLLSPLRGLFAYSPLLLLSIPGLIGLWRRRRAEAALILGTVGVTLLLFAAWSSGEGLSWGSRFLVPLVPLLCVPLAPVLERVLAGSWVSALALVALGGLSLAFQVLGVVINPWVYLARLQADFGGEFFLENTPALVDFGYHQVVGQLRFWSVENSDLAWWQAWGLDGIALGLCLILVATAAVQLIFQVQAVSGATESASATIRARDARHGRERRLATPWPVVLQRLGPGVVVLLAVLTGYLVLSRYYVGDRQFGPPNDGYTRALEEAATRGKAEDRIITLAEYHYHVPMNRFKARMPLIGFARQRGPLPDTALPLLNDALRGDNIWLVTVGLTPAAPDNPVEQWLATTAFKLNDEWLGDNRLVRYAAPRALVTRPMTVTLGNTIQLAAVSWPEIVRVGRPLPVELEWLVLRPPDADYNVFLQLLSGQGVLAAQHDGPPVGGYLRTTRWSPGARVVDRHGLVLPDFLPPGDYRLIVGLYDPASGKRLPASTGGDFVELGMLALQPPEP